MGYLLFPPEMGNPFEDMGKVRNGLLEKEYDALLSVAIFGTSAKRYIPLKGFMCDCILQSFWILL